MGRVNVANFVYQPLRSPVIVEIRQNTIYSRQMAAQQGGRVSAQAVGGAVGHNKVSIIIPCHRVVGADGTLTGFAGGLDVKRRLLELEGVDVCRLCDLLAGRAALGGAPALNRQ